MGLLDDAIREHLELKRQRGADPTEVSRQEREALGPVQRMTPPGPAVDEDDALEPEPPAEDAPPPDGLEAEEAELYDPYVEDPEPAEAGLAPADEGDMLEDTPDFLEETPEHDRLWFEQRPPRDFDFDA
jgi:hypothetical protein